MGDVIHTDTTVASITAGCRIFQENMSMVNDRLHGVTEALEAARQAIADALAEVDERRALRQRAREALDSGDLAFMAEVREELALSLSQRGIVILDAGSA